MWWFERRQAKKMHHEALRARAMGIYDQLAGRTLALTAGERLGVSDDFPLRFDVMVLQVAATLHHLHHQTRETGLARLLWEMTFEGFEESLRGRGVTDIRMAARMNKLLAQGTGRRNAYLAALDAGDRTALREAIARNVLNGAPPDDPRVEVLLESIQEIPHT
ncbi:MAG: hypothetical protein HQM02_11005 [Magnetococcales bacterium]|nr:hypothetical protein [Magnetococcales bacterium]